MQDSQQFAKTQLYTSDKIRESLVHIVLEKSLSSLGIYNSVASEIEKRYNCDMFECYRHPEYLKTILEDKHAETYDLIKIGRASCRERVVIMVVTVSLKNIMILD